MQNPQFVPPVSIWKRLSLYEWGLAAFLLLTVLGIQTARINRPYDGHFGSYQGIMKQMAQNFVREDFSYTGLLQPKLNLVAKGERQLHLNQYPFPSLVVAAAVKWWGGSYEFWGRAQAILFNLLTIILIGLIAGACYGRDVGWMSATIYALSPFSMIYGQMFFSEPMALAALMLSFYLLLPRSGKSPGWGAVSLAGVLFAVTLLGRLHFILVYPALLLLIFRGSPVHRTWRLVLFSLLAFLPNIVWLGHTWILTQTASNLRTSTFAQGGYWKLFDPHYLGSLDYWRFVFDLVSQRMLTLCFFPFFLLGFFLLPYRKPESVVIVSSLFLSSVILFLVPLKILEQDFYFIMAGPFLAFVAGYGFVAVVRQLTATLRPYVVAVFLIACLGISFRYLLHPIFKQPVAPDLPAIELYVRQHTGPSDVIALAHAGYTPVSTALERKVASVDWDACASKESPDFLHSMKAYDAKRDEALAAVCGDYWKQLQFLRAEGADFLLLPSREDIDRSPDFFKQVQEKFRRVTEPHSPFALFDLSAAPDGSHEAV